MDFIIQNGIIVTVSSMYKADIEVSGGKITAVGTDLDTSGREIRDVSGMYVLPGAVDIHTHMSDPFGGTVSSDSETSGSLAAAFGGVTTLFDFATQRKGMHLLEAVGEKRQAYEGKSCIDYTLHCIVTDLLEDNRVLSEFEDVVSYGVNSFKCYLVYGNEGLMVDDEQLARIMDAAAKAGGITAVHAENAGMIDYYVSKFQKEGKLSPWYHYMSRPEAIAAEADRRAVMIARQLNAPLYIVHMDNKEGLKAAAEAKYEGYPVYVETCPHYLEFNSSVYKREDAVKFVCSPPIKGEESRQALWKGVCSGLIDTIATDHCPFTLEEKNWGKDDFTKIPNGCGGIENRFPYMLSAAHDGKLSYSRAVELCCERPAEIFGCTEKGKLEPGRDADIVIYDPAKTVTADRTTTHTACDHTIWDGYQYHGYPVQTYLRGKLICDHGVYKGTPGDGRFIKRSRRKGGRKE